MRNVILALTVTAGLTVPPAVSAQDATSGVPEIGEAAPDFQLTGATRFGVLRDPVQLSDFRGKTVVLSFFLRARTKG